MSVKKARQPAIVSVTRRIAASPEKVYDAWLDPKVIARFLFKPMPGDDIVSLKTSPKVGGKFSFVVLREGKELNHTGKYLGLSRPEQLAFTWGVAPANADRRRVTLDISPRGKGAEVTLTHQLDPAWADYAKQTELGWKKILGALAKELE